MKGSKALVMLSGGLDSATCLYWAKKKFSDIFAITFNYYDRIENEKKATVKLAKRAAVANLLEINIPFIKESSNFFKDATKGYIQKINSLLNHGSLLGNNNEPCVIVLPLAEMDRKKIINLAIELRVPLELTWSCHNKGEVHCGRCYSCLQRFEAFDSLGIQDPV